MPTRVILTSIMAAGRFGTECVIMEFDEYSGDIFDVTRVSSSYLIENSFARGRV